MAFKLDKDGVERREKLVAELREKADKVEDAIAVYNDLVKAARLDVEAALTAYNETLQEVAGFAEDIVSQADQDLSEKSEKWQDSERGQAALAWKEEWDTAMFEQLEIEFPDDIEAPEPTHADDLEALATEIES